MLSDAELQGLSADPLRVVVMGPGNVGKTSLVRTLLDKRDFGTVADEGRIGQLPLPGVRQIDGHDVLKITDAPGFQNVGTPHKDLGLCPDFEEVKRYYARRAQETAGESHTAAQDLQRVINEIGAADVALYVVKPSQEPSQDHDEQLFLSRALGCPAIVIMNRFRNERKCFRDQWEARLKRHALQNDIYDMDARLFDPRDKESLYKRIELQLKDGSAKVKVAKWLCEESKQERESRIKRSAQICRDQAVNLAKLKKKARNIPKQEREDRRTSLSREIEEKCHHDVADTDKRLKEVFGFSPASKVREQKLEPVMEVREKQQHLAKRAKFYGPASIVAGLALDFVTAVPVNVLIWILTPAVISGMANYTIDKRDFTVWSCLTQDTIRVLLERNLRLIQRMYFTGAAGVTDGTTANNAEDIVPGSFSLSDADKSALDAMLCKTIATPNDVTIQGDLLGQLIELVGKAVENRPKSDG